MKTFVKALALTLVLVTVGLLLVSCAPKGVYKGNATTYEFLGGGKVKYTGVTGGTFEGKFEIGENDKGEAIITFSEFTGTAVLLNGTHAYEQGKNFVKIDGIQYVKQ